MIMLSYAREWELNPLKLIYKLRLWQDYDFLNSLALILIVGNLDILELNVSSKKGTFKKVIHKKGMPLAFAQNVKKETIGQINPVLNFIRMAPSFGETASGQAPSPIKQGSLSCSDFTNIFPNYSCQQQQQSELPCLVIELSPVTQGNTALDISSSQDFIVTPGETPTIISTGIFGLLPQGTVGLLLGRSGLTSQGVQIHTGITDNDYEGELKVMVSTTLPWKVSKGDRIAKLLILPYMWV